MKTTIKDIANRAEVSISAVSFALNNKPGVSEETRSRIIRAAEDLGYDFSVKAESQHPELVVRVLKISRHGHTINSNHNFFIDAYIDGINAIAHKRGIILEIGTYDASVPISDITEKMMNSPKIKGYLILGTELSSDDINQILQTGRNVVFMDTFLDYIPADFVDMNNTDAVYKVISYLQKHGHTQIGLIKSSVQTRNFYLREKAFYQVMTDLNIPISDRYIIDVDSTFTGAYEDTLKHLSASPELPTAFFAINDIIALGSMKAFQEKGYVIPDQISFVAFDNLPMASMTSPALTSIDVSKHKIGQNALTMLLSKSEHNECTPPMKTMIGGKLIERDSVKTLTKNEC